MADTESILQLGIEAARAGDKEEARNLFRLLTREAPEDPQAWLWLAGVAEDREEKRVALEQVTQLDPSNDLAQQGLAALGGPRKMTADVPTASSSSPPSAAASSGSTDDFNDDFNVDFTAAPDATKTMQAVPPPVASPVEPARTRDLSPDEEFAMSLDSLGSMSTNYNDRTKSGGSVDFDIPDFGDDLDLDAYMNRERVDMSQIEVSAAEGKKPVRKAISKGGISDDIRAKSKARTPRDPNAPRRASGGFLPLALMALAAVLVIGGLWWFLNRGPDTNVANTTPVPGGAANGRVTTAPIQGGTLPTPDPGGGVTQPGQTLPPLDPNVTQVPTDPNAPQPTVPAAPPPPVGNTGFQPDPTLGNVQPEILPADGSRPVDVNGWFFNFGGSTAIADGNVINLQPQGRWVVVTAYMFNATGQDQPIPGDLLVLKDAQGRVYRPNADASEAYFNTTPGVFNIHQKQNAPAFNFLVPLVFDVAPDATDLVLFSPQKTEQGYRVRDNSQ